MRRLALLLMALAAIALAAFQVPAAAQQTYPAKPAESVEPASRPKGSAKAGAARPGTQTTGTPETDARATQVDKPAGTAGPAATATTARGSEAGRSVSARMAADSAQRLQARGDLEGAVRMLEMRQAECGAADRACRQVLDYSLGYVLQQGSAGSADPVASLRRAAASYEKVLAETPAHGPTLDNVVSIYERLGEPGRAADLLRRGMSADPGAARELSVRLGDLLVQTGSPREARELYSRSLAEDPDDMAVCHRLVLSHELAPEAGSAAELLSWAERWRTTVPEAARDAYEAVIRLAEKSEPALAEQALLAWVDVLGRSGGLSAGDLKSLPATWESPALRDLAAYLEKPEALPGSWWLRGGNERSRALARVALGLGKERLGRGEPERAEAVWRVGRDLAGASEVAKIDLQTELALLYHRHPALDPDGSKFADTEVRLFQGKGEAYSQRDLASIQRHHVALGLIYAERKTWEGPWAHNAMFQLGRALETAAERERGGTAYQPMPYIRERLADGYVATGKTSAAASAYLDACRAYLDVDDLGKAGAMLEKARRLAGPDAAGAREEIGRLAQILPVRRRLAEAVDAAGAPAGPALPGPVLAELAGAPWLAPSWSHPQKDFLARQRFKARADLAVVAARADGGSGPALANAAETLGMALDRQVALVGAGDLLRLERIQALNAGALGLDLADPQIVSGETAVFEALAVSLPSDDEPTLVRVSPEAQLASRIVRQVGVETLRSARPKLQIREGTVVLLDAAPGADVAALATKVRAVAGVGSVAVSPVLQDGVVSQ